ncbi:NADPH:quinone oxidoreductase family protein [Pseudogemmobacter faecipullorum]|uniref:NADPH:quinone oxidoreductase family protein n=1 Tax=Pseudogemmobacter faecipullorum TaxID=2755041 RepID=A0ABS8CLN2_9RHOB|nr:NADPH:quinone oxidoreductase family protein [Pseudogemmobacter faecipullorum]MCB5410289.1 NADPH:quinone oxidoreductase family protein [Pseudogemmobacter faecipullorum]
MMAWQISRTGESASLTELPVPVPGPGEVLVRIRAAGLNFADLLMVQGRYQVRNPLPFIPGLELAGEVVAPESGGAGPAAGTRVAAHVKCGAFAEYALVPRRDLLILPPGMPFATAAGFQIAWGTSHLALKEKAQLRAGETLFVSGASGGVGLTAVSLGHLMGARVIASVRGADKAQIARAAGADVVIDSDTPDLKALLRDLGGIDVTYDTVGGPGFDAAMRATRPGGRMLAIGFAGGDVPQVPLNQLLVRNISVIGLWWGGYLDFAPEVLRDSLAELLSWWGEGRIQPLIAAELAFADLQQGLDAIRRREVSGKLVLLTG